MAPASSVKRRLLPLATLLVAAVLNPVGSFANPTGANVTGGAATVSGQGTSRVTIDQSSDRAFIEWNSFSVAKGESVRFNQPSASSVTANKVVGVAPSDILGAVSANGRIILINPNGIFFGKGSTIDAAGLIATTLDLDKDSFLAGGKFKFSSASDISASVVNEGTLTISDAGLGALVAPHVRNSGALVANLGTAVLASGKAFTVDFTGDGLITFALGEGIASTLVGADGKPLAAQVEQAGEVTASRIVLSAAAAREVVNQSVNVSGLVRAGSADRNADGSISLRGSKSVAVESTAVLEAPTGSIVLDADSVKVAGNIIASSIQLTGDHIAVLAGASLSSNGGSILVGGDWQGSNGVRQAITTHLETGATIDAGQGGTAVLWSDITNAKSVTTVAGTVRALGGQIETSGYLLELPGFVQAGIGVPRNTLLERFRTDERSVLFGVASFWQGVDVRGRALRNVIITRLPFEVPDRPIVQARHELIESRGGKPFSEDSLPRAVLRFKQGFGRLVRSSTDEGRVVVLDPRIITKRYGRMFLDALPDGIVAQVVG